MLFKKTRNFSFSYSQAWKEAADFFHSPRNEFEDQTQKTMTFIDLETPKSWRANHTPELSS